MVKTNPAAGDENRRLDDRKGIKDFVTGLTAAIHADEQDRIGWVESLRESYNRRHAASKYDKPIGTWPWLGASNFDSGISDTFIEELKPSLLNLSHGGRRVYEFQPMNAASVDAASAANVAMDSLLKYRMPDYLLQLAWGIDSLGTYGIKTDKVTYSYKTRVREKTFQRKRLPPVIANLAVYPDLTDVDRQFFAKMNITAMTRDEFDAQSKQIESVVLEAFGLDREDRVDRVALAEVMRFMRSGSSESTLTIKTRQVLEDAPRLVNVPVENIVVPQGVRQIHESERITHWMFFTESEMRQRARDDVWDSAAVDAALEGGEVASLMRHNGSGGDILRQAKLDRAHLTDSSAAEKTFRIAEVFARWDIDNDGLDEDVVITMEPKSGTVLKAMPWDGEIPYTDTFLEATDQDRHASRGVPRQIADFEQHTTALMRGELNSLTTETSRSFTYVEGSGIDPLTLQWMPNLMIPVQDHNDLRPIDMAPRSLALESPMRNMMSFAERRISGANRAVLDMPPPERRTKAEVDAFEGARTRVMTVRAMLYQEGQKRNGKLIWEQWMKHGPDRFWSHITGQPPMQQAMADVTGDFMILPAAATGDMDPEFRSQRAFSRLQVAMQMQPALANDPRWVDDIAQAYIDWLNEHDPQATQRLIKPIPPEQQQQIQAMQQQNAQRAAEIADSARAVQEGAAISEEQMIKLMTAFRKMAPHKELQQIIEQADAAQGVVNRTTAILGSNGAAPTANGAVA